MRVVVVGAGAREHAIADGLAREGATVVVAPGNAGIARSLPTSACAPEEIPADLVVIGPEAPLVAGHADGLRARGYAVVGPGVQGARLEGSKVAMKRLADAAGVPTAAWGEATTPNEARMLLDRFGPPYVIKTDGLAAGKGVLVTHDRAEAERDVLAKLSGEAFGEAGRRVVIEQGLEGRELSLIWLVNECSYQRLPVAQDYKRLLDGDDGPNTGGMGAIAPAPWADNQLVADAEARVLEPLLAELARQRVSYRGFLYAGLMATREGLRLLEVNVRLGDPEAQVIVPLVRSGFLDALVACARGEPITPVATAPGVAVGVVIATRGYPTNPVGGDVVSGMERAEALGARVYAAGITQGRAGELRAAPGRVLTLVGLGDDVGAARHLAYRAVEEVQLEGAQWRRDVGLASE